MNAAEAGEQIGGVLPSPDGEMAGAARQAAPAPRKHRKRWPIWSEPTRCNICGWAGEHSSVCPLGPEPTRSRERR